ncbi:hypothetical protein BDN72DRAFT_850692 [Pluteus cervinus]|uniref:Uncharacterized protein n=1 Tax=Pluteus cervinus TaxID=181527 RepID=A0ACD3A3R5_9AGAR|nr:hypothetical protein BDN72DRAFT_850692 [Pluteus cervinus]
MGRALFSKSYPATTPTVRSEPEPILETSYEKWSRWNFDPDSDEFFHDAEYEAFIDPAAADTPTPPEGSATTDLTNVTAGLALDRSLSPISSVSSDSDSASSASDSESGRASPLNADATATNPSAISAEVRRATSGLVERLRAVAAEEEVQRRTRTTELATLVNRVADMLSSSNPEASARLSNAAAALGPLSNITTDSLASALGNARVQRQRSASASVVHTRSLGSNVNATVTGLRRTVNITPIDIPIEPSAHSPISPLSPATPPSQLSYPRVRDEGNINTIPVIPTIIATPPAPLPNPTARRSVSHLIATLPARSAAVINA